MRNLSLNVPSVFTKELRLSSDAVSGDRRLRISSNLLQLMGFAPTARYERRVLAPAGGFELRLNPAGPVQVYQRTYNHRRNNPTETVIDEHSQEFLNASIPAGIERVHLTMRQGVIIGRPSPERTFYIRKAIRQPSYPLEAFVALSSGVDAACLRSVGFGMQALLEYRPQEKRDTRDLTETGVMTGIANNPFRFVFNEDIFRVDFSRITEVLKDQPRVAILALSPQCDDFTNVKTSAAKLASLDSLDTTVDMFFPCLRLIETVQPAIVHVENVPGFLSSPAGEMIVLTLRRWGYNVNAGVYDARDFGGTTSRKRCYIVASVFPGFEAPAPITEAFAPGRIWRLIEDQFPFCNDATNTSSLQKGLVNLDSKQKGQARLITPESVFAPTVMKSQSRHAKDSVFIAHPDGRYLFPNEEILRRLQGVPADFSLDAVAGDIASEQLGQSIDWTLHHAFAAAIRRHLAVNRGEEVAPEAPRAPAVVQSFEAADSVPVDPQMALFA